MAGVEFIGAMMNQTNDNDLSMYVVCIVLILFTRAHIILLLIYYRHFRGMNERCACMKIIHSHIN